jgi:hypothetical protein
MHKGQFSNTHLANHQLYCLGRVVSQPHFGLSVRMKLTLPKVGTWSPPGLSKTQNLISGVKTPRIGVFFISMERSWSVDVQNGLAWAIWTSAAHAMGKRRVGQFDSRWRTPKSQVGPIWGSNYVELRKVGTWKGAPDFQHYKGVEGRARSLGIRLGRGTSRSNLILHPKPTTRGLVHILGHPTTRGLVHIPGHPWVLGQATSTLTHKTHHVPDSREATTFPPPPSPI